MFSKLILMGVIGMVLSAPALAQSPHPFLPADFEVPATLDKDRFRLRMLSVNDVVRDYDAVMSSQVHLNGLFGSGWPEGLTLEQNLIDLGWHQKEFQRRRSFAYTVVSPDESRTPAASTSTPPARAATTPRSISGPGRANWPVGWKPN